MKTVAEVIGVSRSNLIERMRSDRRNGLAGRRCQTTNSWQRSRRSSPSCQPTATDVSTPSSSAKRWRWLEAAQSQAGLPGDEGPRPAA